MPSAPSGEAWLRCRPVPLPYLEEPALSDCPQSLPRGAGGDRQTPGLRRPRQPEYKVLGGPAPREEEAPSFLPGESHRAVSETAPSPSLSPRRTMALCTSFPPNNSPLHSGRWGRRGLATRDTQQGHGGRTFVSKPKGTGHARGSPVGWGCPFPSPAPPTVGNQTEAPIFQMGTLRLPGVGRSSHINLSSRMRTPSQDSRGLGRGTQETKG